MGRVADGEIIEIDWPTLVHRAVANPPTSVRAEQFRKKAKGRTKPVVLACSDGVDYYVKGPGTDTEVRRSLIAEQVVANLASRMGGPVPRTILVDLPQELIDLQPDELSHIDAGLCHGQRETRDVSEKAYIANVSVPENRTRFAQLAILYGWMTAADKQLFYENRSPRRVWSFDHGAFFDGGAQWSVESLDRCGTADLDEEIVERCQLSSSEYATASSGFKGINEAHVAAAVAIPPEAWSFTFAERIELAKYLWRRMQDLIAIVPT